MYGRRRCTTSCMLRPPERRLSCLIRCLNVAIGLAATLRLTSPLADAHKVWGSSRPTRHPAGAPDRAQTVGVRSSAATAPGQRGLSLDTRADVHRETAVPIGQHLPGLEGLDQAAAGERAQDAATHLGLPLGNAGAGLFSITRKKMTHGRRGRRPGAGGRGRQPAGRMRGRLPGA